MISVVESRNTFMVPSESTGELYEVTFLISDEIVKAHCTCPAGQKLTLCKHVLKCIDENPDVKTALDNSGLWQIYEEHLALLEEAERIKREAKNVKKKFERLLMR